MSREEGNVAALRRAYQIWHDSKGSRSDHWFELFADHVEWDSLANGEPGMEFTRHRSNIQEVMGYFVGLADDWNIIHYTVREFVAQGDRVVAIADVAYRHRRAGKVVETPKVDCWRFENGRAVAFAEFYDTAKALAATRDG